MEKVFEIDTIRQAIYQTLQEEYIKQPLKYLGSENQVSLLSFYEHLQTEEEVDRYVETVRDLNNQQNRTGLIANGIINSPSNTTLVNLNQSFIAPMDFVVNFRCTLANRDMVRDTLEHMSNTLKGRKRDIAILDNGKLFMVGTIANNSIGNPLVRNGDYIGECDSNDINTYVGSRYTTLSGSPYYFTFENYTNGSFVIGSYFYFKDTTSGKLCVAVYDYDTLTETNKWLVKEETNEYPNIIFPPEHNSFTKSKLSVSFETTRCSEPRTLNAEDYCDISFGGSATLCSEGVMLGNDLTKLGIKRYKLLVSENNAYNITFDDIYSWLEPLELPSGNSIESQVNQLTSNKFIANNHADSLTLNLQYTFILDKSIDLLVDFFKFARYGKQTKIVGGSEVMSITPNIIYSIVELWSSWGEVDYVEYKAKIVESIDIENTESDTLTITLPVQIQGENN